MGNNLEKESTPAVPKVNRPSFIYLVGIIMIAIGILILTDQFLKTGWLPLALVPVFGLIFLVEALRTHRLSYLILGSLLTAAGAGGFVGFSALFNRSKITLDVGWALVGFSLGWVLIAVLSRKIMEKPAYWSLVPAGILFSTGLAFLLSDLRLVDFVLWVGTGSGLVLLIWGINWRIFGLIIPGSLLASMGPGIYLAWGRTLDLNPLAKTGVMIAIFSMGWFLIILFSRVLTSKFVWWPLIPGGILAMVGWGLYIGGDPASAPTFIANTGSIGLIIFGIYLLLMRKGIHH
ncbi:MAG: hypothetical protein ACYC3H_02870 [Bellilinea sp.]